MSAPDAAVYWRSATQRSDIFAVYCFDVPDTPISMDAVVDELRGRARGIGDLCQRVLNVPGDLDRPYWVGSGADCGRFAVHAVSSWQGCLDRLGELDGDQLDPTECAWRIHIFGPLTGAPQGCSARGGEAIVVALQVSHALADGRGNAAICRALFGAVPPQYDACTDSPASGRLRFMRWGLAAAGVVRLPVSAVAAIWLGLRSFNEYRKAARRGPVNDGPGAVAFTEINRPPGPERTMRVIVLDRRSLPAEYSVTVVALTAASFALDELLESAPRRTAELTVGRSPRPGVRNNFGNVGIDLHPEIDDPGERMMLIAGGVAAAQRRAATPDPVAEASRRFESVLPAFLVRRAIRRFDERVKPLKVAGVTVVSSVNRGPDDLVLAGARIRFTTGFPTLSPFMGLVHGLDGMGHSITMSVTTSPEIVDADTYVEMLRRALDRLTAIGTIHR